MMTTYTFKSDGRLAEAQTVAAYTTLTAWYQANRPPIYRDANVMRPAGYYR
jgi:hypothetical protein